MIHQIKLLLQYWLYKIDISIAFFFINEWDFMDIWWEPVVVINRIYYNKYSSYDIANAAYLLKRICKYPPFVVIVFCSTMRMICWCHYCKLHHAWFSSKSQVCRINSWKIISRMSWQFLVPILYSCRRWTLGWKHWKSKTNFGLYLDSCCAASRRLFNLLFIW